MKDKYDVPGGRKPTVTPFGDWSRTVYPTNFNAVKCKSEKVHLLFLHISNLWWYAVKVGPEGFIGLFSVICDGQVFLLDLLGCESIV